MSVFLIAESREIARIQRLVQCRDCPESSPLLTNLSGNHRKELRKYCLKLDKVVKPFASHKCNYHPDRKRKMYGDY